MRDCNLCALRATARQVVWPDGPLTAKVVRIGEAPGEQEDKKGKPFVGKSGMEDENYLRMVGLNRADCYTSNLVKCRPPKNRDPLPAEIEACSVHLEEELGRIRPDAIIATLGRYSTRYLLGKDVSMEYVHGIPQQSPRGWVVVPVYHPAVGLYNTTWMTLIMQDYEMLARVVNGYSRPEDWDDPFPNPIYRWARSGDIEYLKDFRVLSVDTESISLYGEPFSIQLTGTPGESVIFRAEDAGCLAPLFMDERNLFIFHNARHDLKVLQKLGLTPSHFTDTMLAANLLQDVPKGLKALSYRLTGMQMKSYEDLVEPYTRDFAFKYLLQSLEVSSHWPKPDTGQRTYSKIKRMFTDLSKNPNINLYDRYCNLKEFEREWLAQELGGPLSEASVADLPDGEFRQYAGADSDATYRIYPILMARVESSGLSDALARDCRVVPMVMDMEVNGTPASKDYFECLDLIYAAKLEDITAEIQQMVKYEINPGSDDQIADLLFNRLKLKAPRRTKGGGASTDDEVLNLLRNRNPVIPLIQDYRNAKVMKSNFVSSVLTNLALHGDGRVRPDFIMTRVVTGRLASKVVNLLAYPKEKLLRDGFQAGPGRVFVSGDYSQIELRVLAHMSQDEGMIECFMTGRDLHRETASVIFNIPPEEVTSEQRRAAKFVNFGIPYGRTAQGLLNQLEELGWTLFECEELLSGWHKTWRKASLYLTAVKDEARRYGLVRDLFGRYRLVPEVRSTFSHIREAGLRQAINAPIQSGSQGIIKEAMGLLVPVYREIQCQGHYITPLMQIHDDIVWEMDEGIVSWVIPIIKGIMENAVTLSVPITVEFKLGRKWGSMEGVDL